MRKPGWYWVKWDDSDPWQCAQWDDGGWWMSGDDMHIGNELVVGPRIPTPDESVVVPEGWSVQHIDDPSSDGYLVRGPGISYCVWKDREAWLYLFFDAMLAAAPKPETQP